MKRRAFGAACVAALIGALTGSIALADNPHGTPPGQAKQDQSAPAASTTTTMTTTSATTTTQSPSSTPPPSGKYAGCTSSSAQSDGTGVKPSNDTKKSTCAPAGSANTKEYGNGKTAGGIATSRGAPASTPIYGPGNSQPHKVATCPDKHGKVHYKDVHAVKSYPAAGCATSSASGSASQSTSGNSSTSTTATTSNNASTTNNSSVANNSSVTNNTTTTNNTSATNNASTTNGASVSNTPSATMGSTSPSTTSGVKGATHSSSPSNATSPAKATSPAQATSPATAAKGVLGATAKRGDLPFTGLPLWFPALASLGLLGAGLGLRRFGRLQA